MKTIRPIYLHGILIIIFSLAWVNGNNPILRFSNSGANLIFESMVYLIPLVLVINGFRFKVLQLKVTNLLVLLIPVLFCSFFFLATVSWFIRGHDPRGQVVDGFESNNYRVVLIRTNGSAISQSSMSIRQEKKIGLGLLLAKELYIETQDSIDFKIIKVEDDQLEFDDVDGKRRILKLKQYLYW